VANKYTHFLRLYRLIKCALDLNTRGVYKDVYFVVLVLITTIYVSFLRFIQYSLSQCSVLAQSHTHFTVVDTFLVSNHLNYYIMWLLMTFIVPCLRTQTYGKPISATSKKKIIKDFVNHNEKSKL